MSAASQSLVTASPQERTETPMRPIAHLPNLTLAGKERGSLCGAPVLGIPAFGDFDPCVVCDAMWGERYG